MNKQVIFIIVIIFAGISELLAGTKYYRASYRDDPSTTIVIGWSPDGTSSNAQVYYGKEDFGTTHTLYPFSHGIDRTVDHQGITNNFARLTGLEPNTVYYFIIRDDQSVSQRMSFKTLPDDPNEPITFISGGDTRTGAPFVEFESDMCRPRRQMGNELAAKIRPDFIAFSGDFVFIPGDDGQWEDWWSDWQLTIGSSATKGRVLPVLTVYGNHEQNDDIYNFFDIPNPSSYYAINMGGNLLRFYCLNSDLECDTEMIGWFESDLQNYSQPGNKPYWKAIQFHVPIAPHGEYSVLNNLIGCWTNLFQQYGIRLAMEGHTHVMKITNPVVPGSGAGSDNGLIQDDENGTVYLGEGSWGAPMRELYTSANGKAYNWTYAQGRFPGFNIVTVKKTQMEIKTIEFNDPNSVSAVPENAPSGTLPSGLDYWDMTSGGDYTYIIPNTHFSFSDDATLSQLSTSEGELEPAFSPTNTSYTVSLPAGSTIVPTCYPIPNDPNATVSISNAQNLTGSQSERTSTIEVVAENNTSIMIYTIEFLIETGNDATLLNLTTNMGVLNPSFSPNVFNYTVDLPTGTTQTPSISATLNDPEANLTLTQPDSPNGTGTAHVVSADESVENTYTVVYNVAAEDAKEITSFDIPGQVSSEINQTGSTILVEMPLETDVTNLIPEITYIGASVSPASGVAQNFASPVTYTVEAADGTTRDYIVTVETVEATSDNANLASLVVNPGNLEPAFSTNTLHYNVEIPEDLETVEITATAEDPRAEVRIFMPSNLHGNLAERTANVLVIASDRETTKLYSVIFHSPNAIGNQQLKESVIYPNPATQVVNIDLESLITDEAMIVLHNGFGQKLLEIKPDNQHIRLDISHYPRGIYFILVKNNQKIDLHKFLKQ
jgi:hypothetical protein